MPSYQNLAKMANVFLDSAKVLLKEDKIKFKFVIVYMLGTSIELYLKAIITIKGQESPSTHDLSSLANLANADTSSFLKNLTHHLYWKSKYHEASKPEFEKSFYEMDNVAEDYDEIISYIEKLKNIYLNVNE